MWEAVRYGDVDYYEDRWALDALIAVVPPGTPSLRHASTATVPARPRCSHFAWSGCTWPLSQVRTLMTLLSVSTLYYRRWCSSTMTPTTRREPSRSSSIASLRSTSRSLARSIESLLDLSTMSIEEAIGCLKVIDGNGPQPLSRPITMGRKLHLTRE
jgi:hypothetical protein